MARGCALPSAGSSTTAKCKTVMIISVSGQELFNAISPPHADPGRLERGPPAPRRPSLSGPSLCPRHGSERRCFKCQTGHTCEGPVGSGWIQGLAVGRPQSREPEAKLQLIVCRQLSYRGGGMASKKKGSWGECAEIYWRQPLLLDSL